MSVIQCWEMRAPGGPLALARREINGLDAGQVLIRVAGCGVCHTDLGYLYDGVRTRHGLPLTLGHEIAGVVEQAGRGAEDFVNQSVVVPAVIPCARCELCKRGRGSICKKQIFPGNDVHGGFASHVVLPAEGLCPVDPGALKTSGLALADLSVVADAITTPYQSILRSGLEKGDVAIFVGAGGVGSFGVQIARALGAHVIALDVNPERLSRVREHGAARTWDVREMKPRDVRAAVRDYIKAENLPDAGWKIFETSGTAAGQRQAFELLGFGAYLGVVGYTLDSVDVRLSNLMAFDATAQGSWGCLPAHYPAVIDMVLRGDVKVGPFVEHRPMSRINETFEDIREKRLTKRPILVPDFA